MRADIEAMLVMPPAAAASGSPNRAQKLTLSAVSTAETAVDAAYYTFYSTTDAHISTFPATGGPAANANDWFLPAGQERSYFFPVASFFRAIQDTSGGTLWFYRSNQ